METGENHIVEPDVLQYTNYRMYLRDYYEFKKKTVPAFSLRFFAEKAGLSSHAHLKLTIDGKSFVEVPGDDRTTILVTLTATGGKRVSDFVNRDVNYFDGIRFDFTLLKPTQPGAKIFSDMKVRLEDMKMGIIGAGYDGN